MGSETHPLRCPCHSTVDDTVPQSVRALRECVLRNLVSEVVEIVPGNERFEYRPSTFSSYGRWQAALSVLSRLCRRKREEGLKSLSSVQKRTNFDGLATFDYSGGSDLYREIAFLIVGKKGREEEKTPEREEEDLMIQLSMHH